MTDETPKPDAAPPTDSSPTSDRKGLKTLVFLLIIAGVVGTFAYLSSLEHPPNLPDDGIHKFRFDTQGQLVGIAFEAPGEPLIVEHSDLELDLKAIETRINKTCASCHGAPGQDLSQHPCIQGGRCIPPQHPPKDTCIKCHRHGEP